MVSLDENIAKLKVKGVAQLNHLLSMNMAWVQAPAQSNTNLKWWSMPRLYTYEVEAGISEV